MPDLPDRTRPPSDRPRRRPRSREARTLRETTCRPRRRTARDDVAHALSGALQAALWARGEAKATAEAQAHRRCQGRRELLERGIVPDGTACRKAGCPWCGPKKLKGIKRAIEARFAGADPRHCYMATILVAVVGDAWDVPAAAAHARKAFKAFNRKWGRLGRPIALEGYLESKALLVDDPAATPARDELFAALPRFGRGVEAALLAHLHAPIHAPGWTEATLTEALREVFAGPAQRVDVVAFHEGRSPGANAARIVGYSAKDRKRVALEKGSPPPSLVAERLTLCVGGHKALRVSTGKTPPPPRVVEDRKGNVVFLETALARETSRGRARGRRGTSPTPEAVEAPAPAAAVPLTAPDPAEIPAVTTPAPAAAPPAPPAPVPAGVRIGADAPGVAAEVPPAAPVPAEVPPVRRRRRTAADVQAEARARAMCQPAPSEQMWAWARAEITRAREAARPYDEAMRELVRRRFADVVATGIPPTPDTAAFADPDDDDDEVVEARREAERRAHHARRMREARLARERAEAEAEWPDRW